MRVLFTCLFFNDASLCAVPLPMQPSQIPHPNHIKHERGALRDLGDTWGFSKGCWGPDLEKYTTCFEKATVSNDYGNVDVLKVA